MIIGQALHTVPSIYVVKIEIGFVTNATEDLTEWIFEYLEQINNFATEDVIAISFKQFICNILLVLFTVYVYAYLNFIYNL